MFGFIVSILIILIVAVASKMLCKIRLEVALFSVITSIMLVLTVAGLFSLMKYAQIIIYTMAVVSLGYILYVIVIRKDNFEIESFLTPGLVLFLFSVFFYYLSVRHNVFHLHDEVSAYGTAVKQMLYTHKVALQGIVPVFSYFITSITGYSEGIVYTSRWIFIWSCMILPLANIPWKKSYWVLLFGLVGFGVVTIINPEPLYYMDAPVGVMAGALVGYLVINYQKMQILPWCLGLMVLVLTKDMAGILFGMYTVGAWGLFTLIQVYSKKEALGREVKVQALTVLAAVVLAILLAYYTVGIPKVIVQLFSSWKVILLSLALIGIVLMAVFFRKCIVRLYQKLNRHTRLIMGIGLMLIISFAVYKIVWMIILSMDYGLQGDFVRILQQYFNKNYFGFRLISLVGIWVACSIGLAVLALKSLHRRYFIAQGIIILITIFSYGFVIAYTYTHQYAHLIHTMMSLERYMGTMIIFILVWLMSFFFAGDVYWIKAKAQTIAICIYSALLLKSYPVVGETMFNVYEPAVISFKEGVRPFAQKHAQWLAERTPDNARILYINQDTGDNYSAARIEYWINYFLVPRSLGLSHASFTTEPDTKYGDNKTVSYDVQTLGNAFYRCDYVYVMSHDERFWLDYGSLFPVEVTTQHGTLFRVDRENKMLIWVGDRSDLE